MINFLELFDEGYSAYLNCLGIDDNPCPKGTPGYYEWARGWYMAEDESLGGD